MIRRRKSPVGSTHSLARGHRLYRLVLITYDIHCAQSIMYLYIIRESLELKRTLNFRVRLICRKKKKKL